MRGTFFRTGLAAQFLAVAFLCIPQGGRAGVLQENVLQSPTKSGVSQDQTRAGLADALPPEEWAQVEKAVDRALAWLSIQQQPDGSFPTFETGQPAVTSLCVLAFLARGHQPGSGPYGRQLNRAIDYVLKSQQPSGLMTYGSIEPTLVHHGASHTASYNHAIAGLMLTEVFGSVSGEQAKRIKLAVEKALEFTIQIQHQPAKAYQADEGGWRYIRTYEFLSPLAESDLSVTSWQLMFLRSAKNAEFNVPDKVVQSAMAYVERCYDESAGMFYYGLDDRMLVRRRAMVGAGILSLSLGGKHHTKMALQAGDWLLAHPFNFYGPQFVEGDRFHYAAYYCSQAMAQLGGQYWKGFFPPLVRTMLQNQSADGSWLPEQGGDEVFGNEYTTALAVLALTPPLQLLPIFQR
jgi:hypothetical protein